MRTEIIEIASFSIKCIKNIMNVDNGGYVYLDLIIRINCISQFLTTTEFLGKNVSYIII